jgi:hypothetical protein
VSTDVFYDNANEFATLTVTFKVNGVATDPTAVTCLITDPAGGQVTHSFGGSAPADVTKPSTGNYKLDVACSPSVTGIEGLWSYAWVGTGAAAGAVGAIVMPALPLAGGPCPRAMMRPPQDSGCR